MSHHKAGERRVEDIDGRLMRWRQIAWAATTMAAVLLAMALAPYWNTKPGSSLPSRRER